MSDRRTINAKGEVVPKPYGVGRWSTPRRRECVHKGCGNEAKVLSAPDEVERTHNCCKEHQ